MDGIDGDGDGYASRATGGNDCDDADPVVHPGAADTSVDGLDQDCSGLDGGSDTQRTDGDGDGYDAVALGGVDCDDTNAAINPAATDLTGDAFDQNCDGVDGFDGDADGVAAAWSGGRDCDDLAAAVHPGAEDASTDGVDQDCSGVDGVDADGDGHPAIATGGTDCDDADAAVHPGARDDATAGDQDCDGQVDEDPLTVAEIDFDRDGFGAALLGGDDCDDLNGAVNPRATDLVGDDEDQNCDGIDGTDADADGVASRLSGGTDCDDLRATVNPAKPDVSVDGVDQDCFGVDGVDADGDGFASEESGGTDCDDADEEISPAGFDLWVDSVDQDCNGEDGDGVEPSGLDEDRDGFVSLAEGGRDCDDHRAGISPVATDMVGDDVDQNCDGVDGTDADRDGQISVASGGLDCADDDRYVFFGAAWKERDEGDNPFCARDEDGDGWGDRDYEAPEMYAWGAGVGVHPFPGHDCDDTRATAAPDLLDLDPDDGLDANCDGSDMDDNDADGYADVDAGGDDCYDDWAGIHPDPRIAGLCGYDRDLDGFVGREWTGAPPDGWDTGSATDTGTSTSTGTGWSGAYVPNGTPETGPREACWLPEFGLCIEFRDGANQAQFCAENEGDYDAQDGCGGDWGTAGSCVVEFVPGVAANIHSSGWIWANEEFCEGESGTWFPDGSGGTLSAPRAGSDCDDDDEGTYPGSAANEGDPDLCAHDRDGDGWANESEGGSDCLDDRMEARVLYYGPEGQYWGDNWEWWPVGAAFYPGAAALEPALCGADADGDGYARAGVEATWWPDYGQLVVDFGVVPHGEGTAQVYLFDPDALDRAGVDWGTDCVDTDEDVRPGTARNEPVGTCTADRDGDGWGDTTIAGHDCDDTSAAVVPRLEVCNDLDDDCDGAVDNNSVDADHDGSPSCVDCDDHDAARATGRVEVCDGGGVDNDCNPDTNDNLDDDGDGFTVCGGDCAALDGGVYPGSLSWEQDPTLCAADQDGDGYGAAADGGSDCDDTASYIHPDEANGACGYDWDGDGAVREEDGGTDCNDDSSESLRDPLTGACGYDGDGDGYVADWAGGSDCSPYDEDVHPGRNDPDACGYDNDNDGYVQTGWGGTDCHDGDPAIYPGAATNEPDACGEDVDGDGYVSTDWGGTDCVDWDETVHPGTATNEPDACTYDQDGDGWGDHYFNGTDCDDGDPGVFPVPETCNGQDDDCDGAVDEIDEDDDGVTLCDGDCDDAEPARFPGNAERCDGLDNDCDASTDENADGDGDGYSLCDSDCDDTRATVSPRGVDGGAHGDECDGLDNDCDGLVDETTTCQGCEETLAYGNSYLNCGAGHTWDDARTYCQALGGDLASAETTGESVFIRNLNRFYIAWVGAFPSGDGAWALVSGGTYRFEFQDWVDDDRRLASYYTGGYFQRYMYSQYAYTCERPAQTADGDGDGYVDEAFGGTDCDDADADVHPDTRGRVCGLDGDDDGEVRQVDGGRDCDDANPASYTTDVDSDCDGQLVELDDMERIPAGLFDMGCTASQSACYSNELPVMPVTLTRDYYVARTEVTQAQFAALMGYNPSYFSCPTGDCPVEQVSWHEAAAYANAASEDAGLTACYTCTYDSGEPFTDSDGDGFYDFGEPFNDMDGNSTRDSGSGWECSSPANPYTCAGYRLPTEAEWEGAARCGTDLRYAGSDDAYAVAWWYDNSYDSAYGGRRTHGVGQLGANACGLYDMSGNVWEWVHDGYDEIALYDSSGRTDPMGIDWWGYMSVRGGGHFDGGSGVRVAVRSGYGSGSRVPSLGFRLARTAP